VGNSTVVVDNTADYSIVGEDNSPVESNTVVDSSTANSIVNGQDMKRKYTEDPADSPRRASEVTCSNTCMGCSSNLSPT
jgi:hypothetical protein